jgi:hypothetical protein
MIILAEQPIPTQSAFLKAGNKERSELILDLNEPHLANLMALRHAPLKVYRRLHRHD